MHSYEIAFDNWFVPAENLIGGDAGVGRGFYLQMAGFENGRPADGGPGAGVMQAALRGGVRLCREQGGLWTTHPRLSTGTRAKLARMTVPHPVRPPILL